MRVFFAALVFCAFAHGLSAYKVKDARGVEFEFAAPPKVATIVPSVTEIIFAIGADENLLADSRYCVYPDGAKLKPKIGGYIDPDYEKIALLKPELFVLPGVKDSRMQERLAKFSIPCFLLHREGLENISADVRMMGELFQKRARAEEIAEKIDALVREREANKKIPDSKKMRALFLFGNMAAGAGSYVGDLLEVCGFANCAAAAGKPWPALSREFLLKSNPEIVFVAVETEAERKEFETLITSDPVWRAVAAVKNGRVHFIPRDAVIVPAPRVVEAVALMKSFAPKN